MILGATGSSFQVSWSFNSTQKRTFLVQVYRGEELLRTASTQGTALEVTGLEAGVLYWVKTSYPACGANVTAMLPVRTGKTLVGMPCVSCELVFPPRLLSPEIQIGNLLLSRQGQAWTWPPS